MPKSVLIVDDEIDTLKLLKMIVEISGYEAYTTLNSLEALTMAQVEQPDVVLLDIMMPKLDGFQLCKMMRADPQTSQLPIIFVTAYSALDLEDRRKESGGDMVLPKPVGMDTLVKAIEEVQEMERKIPEQIKQASVGLNGAKPDEKKAEKTDDKADAKTDAKTDDKADAKTDAKAENKSAVADDKAKP